jgi:tetratricopeptide (TPR) repeat protein
LAQRLKTPADSSHELAGRHLDRLADLGVRGAGVDVLRAVWLAQGGQAAEATALLEPLVHAHPFAAIERMRLNLMLDRKSEARGDAVIVADNMERAKRGGKTLTADDFRWWCMAEDVLARKARLRAILNDWLKLEPQNNDALTLASQFGLVELDEAIRERTTDPRQLVDSIRRLFASGDPPAEARGRIAELYRSRSDIAALNEAFGLLLHSTDLPSTLAEVLGTAAATEEDWKVAQPLLEQTVRQTPGNFAAWNNLAYVLLKQNQDLDRALMAAEKALGSNSNNFHFRETRGQILAKLHRWQDAVTDLEFALNGIPQGKNIHASLAQAYAALGNAELAATHAQYSQ